MDHREQLEGELDRLIDFISQNGIRQRTPEWEVDKKDNIGGSSIATIMGLGYSTLKQLIAERAKPRAEKPPVTSQIIADRAAMNWGTVFEDVLCTYVEKFYRCNIKGAELYYRDYEKYPNLCYSPDGLGIFDVIVDTAYMEVQTEDGIDYVPEVTKRPTICLFEFKCPWTRIPTGRPPNYYVPQVKMGLQMLGVPTHGVFIEAVFRHCSMQQLGFGPEFNKTVCGRNGTPINRRTGFGSPPLACGIIAFTGANIETNVDLGLVPQNILMEILYNAAEGAYEIDYEIFLPDDDIKLIQRPPAITLPWKLFRMDVHIIDKEPNYLDPWFDRIKASMKAVDMTRGDPEKIDQIMMDCGL